MTVAFDKVRFSYGSGQEVLRSLSFQLEPADVLLILGQNGAGKSSMLKLLNGINTPGAGDVLISGISTKGRNTADLASSVSVTFQNPADQLFATSVLKEAEYGPRNLKRRESRALASRALEMFMLDTVASVHPYDLPFAQKKMLTLASAVAMQTDILAFDEPSVSLSQRERGAVLQAVRQLREERRTLLIVSHDIELFLPVSTKALILHGGSAAFFGEASELQAHETILRQAGMRFPLSYRLRPYAGLPPVALQ